MRIQKTHFLAGFFVALLAAFLFIGIVSADDGTGTETATLVQEGTPVPAGTEVTEEGIGTSTATETPEATPTVLFDQVTGTATGMTLTDVSVDENEIQRSSEGETPGEISELSLMGNVYFTVGTITYHYTSGSCAGLDNCTPSSTPFKDALAKINSGSAPSDRKIYVSAGTISNATTEPEITIEGSNAYINQLTGLIGAGSDGTTLEYYIHVNNEKAGFTISGFTVNGGFSLDGNTGTVTLNDLVIKDSLGNGVSITNQKGAVVIKDVSVNDSKYYGATIATDTTAAYPVTIANSAFDNNDTLSALMDGLKIVTKGSVSINGVSVNGNHDGGLKIISPAGITIINAVLSNNGTTSGLDNSGYGLSIQSSGVGSITLQNVEANNNKNNGLLINSAGVVTLKQIAASNNEKTGASISGESGPYATSVTIIDGEFSYNQASGLSVLSKGNILLSNVTANTNLGGYGVSLDNCLNGGPGTCIGNGTVTLLNPSTLYAVTFNNNLLDGVKITSSGNVIVNSISASGNGGNGLNIVNNFTGKTGGITINTFPGDLTTDSSNFKNNQLNGITIKSNGAVSIIGLINNYFWIKDNEDYGVWIDNSSASTAAPVTIKYLYNQDDKEAPGVDVHHYESIYVQSKGNISLTDVRVNDTYGSFYIEGTGILLDNSHGTGSILVNGGYSNNTGGYGYKIVSNGTVTLTNFTAFENGSDGINISTKAAVSLTSIQVDGSSGYGAYIDNCLYDSLTRTCKSGAPISILGTNNYFDDNTLDGLFINTIGLVTLNDVEADDNEQSGINITAPHDLAVVPAGGVKIINPGQNDTSFNLQYGVYIYTYGPVSLQGMDVSYSGNSAVYVFNQNSASPQPVTLKDILNTASGNTGIFIRSKGAVQLINVNSSSNFANNIPLNNGGETVDSCLPGGEVYYSFEATAGEAIDIDFSSTSFSGYISIKGADFNTQQSLGASASFDFTATSGGSYVIYISNWSSPMRFYRLTFNDPTNANIVDLTNDTTGLDIDNSAGTGDVTISKGTGTASAFNSNAGEAVKIITNGKVVISDTQAAGNNGKGISVSANGVNKTITLTRVTSSSNGGDGFTLLSKGSITAASITANNNNGEGFSIDNRSINQLPMSVVVISSSFSGNKVGNGLTILTNGSVTVTSTKSSSNYQSGIYIDNSASITPLPVTMSDDSINGSKNNSGLIVYSKGNITLTNVSSSNNAINGATLDNYLGGNGSGTITINSTTGSAFSYNKVIGLQVTSKGAIKLNATKALTAFGNNNSVDGKAAVGMLLINNVGGSTAGITLTGIMDNTADHGTITAEWNKNDGINIQSNGPVVINYVFTYGNGEDGIQVGNESGATGPSSVVVSNLRVINSTGDGLNIYAKGAVTAGAVLSKGNGKDGIYINSLTTVLIKNINAVENNTTSGNTGYGAEIFAKGNVTLDSIIANNNYQGAFVYTDGTVTMLGSLYTNHFDGSRGLNALAVYSNKGAATLNKFTASNNSHAGVYVYSLGKLIVSNGVTSNNFEAGFTADVFNGSAVNSLISYGNGIANNGSGLTLNMNGGTVSISNSSFIKNSGNGIRIITNSANKPIITNTTYFGNDTNDSGDKNLYIGL